MKLSYDDPIIVEHRPTTDSTLEKYGIYKRYKDVTFEALEEKGIPEQVKEPTAKAKAYAKNIRARLKDGAGLILRGGVGTGKTTLSVCIMREALKQDVRAYFLSLPSLASGLLSRKDAEERSKFNHKINTVPLLVIDDLGAETEQRWVVNRIEELINERTNRSLPTIVTTNLRNEELTERYTRRTLDRIRSFCEVITCRGESLRKPLTFK